MNASWRAASLAALASLATSCSLILDSERVQCSEDSECSPDVTGVNHLICEKERCVTPSSRWYCRGQGVEEVEEQEVMVRFNVADLQSDMPLDASARLCKTVDPNCVVPLAGPFLTDAKGNIEIPASTSVVGFVEITAADHFTAIIPVEFPREGSPVDDVRLFTQETIDNLTGLLDVKVDLEGKGHAILRAKGCGTYGPGGIAYRVSPLVEDSLVLYSQDAVPSFNAKTTDDGNGQVLLLNLPPGFISLTGTVPSTDGPALELGEITFIARKGAFVFATYDARTPIQ